MATEHLMLIDVSDLRAVRLQCKTCGATASLRLDQAMHLPPACVGCGEEWSEDDAPAMQSASRLADAMKEWLGADRGSKARFTLRFELSPMTHAAPRPAGRE